MCWELPRQRLGGGGGARNKCTRRKRAVEPYQAVLMCRPPIQSSDVLRMWWCAANASERCGIDNLFVGSFSFFPAYDSNSRLGRRVGNTRDAVRVRVT